jgi:hypothetical protein
MIKGGTLGFAEILEWHVDGEGFPAFFVDFKVVFMTVEYNISLAARKRGITKTY